MEIKVFCKCGSKYKFDVEPVNGRLPGPVSCPVCGADGTEQSNLLIQEKLAGAAPAVPAASVPAPASPPVPGINISIPKAPGAISIPPISIPGVGPALAATVGTGNAAPSAAGSASVPPASAASPAGIAGAVRVGGLAPSAPAIPAPATPAAAAGIPGAVRVGGLPASAPAASPIIPVPATPAMVVPSGGGSSLKVGAHTPAAPPPMPAGVPSAPPPPLSRGSLPSSERSGGNFNFTLGVVGAVVAGVIGLIIWYALISALGRSVSIVAWGIGGLVGGGARLLARGVSPKLGLVAGASALLAIVMGAFLGVSHVVGSVVETSLNEAYQIRVVYAKEAVAAAKTDEELKKVIATNEGMDLDKVTPQQVADFRKKELPELRKLADATTSKSSWKNSKRSEIEAEYGIASVFASRFGYRLVICALLGVGTAWRLASQGK